MKIAICDDDQVELSMISQYVNEYINENLADKKAEIHKFESSTDLHIQIENGKHFDIYFLDVIMPHISGIELAAEIRLQDHVAKIIFLTSSREFAIESYSVDAFNYLLKPSGKDKIYAVLEKVILDISNTLKQYIIVKSQTNLTKVFFHRLIYVEVLGRVVYFHDADGLKLESNNTIAQIETTLLVDNRFVKPHRSFIVNLDYIKRLSPDGFTTTNDQFIPISRNLYKDVKQKYINHSFESVNS